MVKFPTQFALREQKTLMSFQDLSLSIVVFFPVRNGFKERHLYQWPQNFQEVH